MTQHFDIQKVNKYSAKSARTSILFLSHASMQDNLVNMKLIYVNMQLNYVDMKLIYATM